ncbi:MAG TPA: 30S ribosomal protein S18 [Fusobacteria bacterium]|nr:30S ribosomal protein S18 [Fusobacteriota bacterium]|tara:strand:+ start:692 stop:907 length:216 start_codon:yes stop_codon:yes gene_type:complete
MKRRKIKKRCEFSQKKIGYVDYKDIDLLKRFVTEKGRMLPAKTTGLCSAYQKKLTTAIKRARHMALLPFIN